jgi:hypothetical protein
VKQAFKEPGIAQGVCHPSLNSYNVNYPVSLMASRSANGITLNGVKYMCLQASDQELLGRKGVSDLSRLYHFDDKMMEELRNYLCAAIGKGMCNREDCSSYLGSRGKIS